MLRADTEPSASETFPTDEGTRMLPATIVLVTHCVPSQIRTSVMCPALSVTYQINPRTGFSGAVWATTGGRLASAI